MPQVNQALRIAMFNELSFIWRADASCRQLHCIFTDWRPRELPSSICSRLSTSWYYDFSCGHARTNARLHYLGIVDSPNCRRGCIQPESLEHVFFHCPFYDKERKLICKRCDSLGVEASLGTFLSDKRMHRHVEQLISTFLQGGI